MSYLNSIILVGKFYDILKINNDISCLTIVLSNEDGNTTIPIIISTTIVDKIHEHIEIDDIIGIKGHIDTDIKGLTIISDKITYIHSKRAD